MLTMKLFTLNLGFGGSNNRAREQSDAISHPRNRTLYIFILERITDEYPDRPWASRRSTQNIVQKSNMSLRHERGTAFRVRDFRESRFQRLHNLQGGKPVSQIVQITERKDHEMELFRERFLPFAISFWPPFALNISSVTRSDSIRQGSIALVRPYLRDSSSPEHIICEQASMELIAMSDDRYSSLVSADIEAVSVKAILLQKLVIFLSDVGILSMFTRFRIRNTLHKRSDL
jgi:hypothetical protein